MICSFCKEEIPRGWLHKTRNVIGKGRSCTKIQQKEYDASYSTPSYEPFVDHSPPAEIFTPSESSPSVDSSPSFDGGGGGDFGGGGSSGDY